MPSAVTVVWTDFPLEFCSFDIYIYFGTSCKPHDWDLCLNSATLLKAVVDIRPSRFIRWNIFWQLIMINFGVKVNMKSKAHCFLTNVRYLVEYVEAVNLLWPVKLIFNPLFFNHFLPFNKFFMDKIKPLFHYEIHHSIKVNWFENAVSCWLYCARLNRCKLELKNAHKGKCPIISQYH